MIEKTSLVIDHLLVPIRDRVDDLKHFRHRIWFWKGVVKKSLLRFLNFSVDQTLIKTAESLLFAYSFPGTMEGIIRLSQGLFGDNAIVIIDDIEPAVLNITIKNANENFLFSLSKGHFALTIEERFTMATSDLAEVVHYDPRGFFRLFLTPGRVLKDLEIQ